MTGLVESLLVALSLCADCFAVALCSGVTMGRISGKRVALTAIVFATIHMTFLLAGWSCGNIFVDFIEHAAKIIGFLLLLYVGGNMFVGGVKGGDEVRNLDGLRNIILGAVATSIDALAVGVSQSLTGVVWEGMLPLLVLLFVITVISVTLGIYGGRTLGHRLGHWAEIAGGLVLVGIGVSVLVG